MDTSWDSYFSNSWEESPMCHEKPKMYLLNVPSGLQDIILGTTSPDVEW